MPLIKDGETVADKWLTVADCEPLPRDKPCVVSLPRLLAEAAVLKKRAAPLGVSLAPGDDPDEVRRHLARLELVVLHFDTFKDGRAFSQARIIRSRYGYKGEIRAVGHILRDQLLFLHRCGVNAVQTDERVSTADWQQALKEFSYVYQPAADNVESVAALRRKDSGR